MSQVFDLARLRQLEWPKSVDWNPAVGSTNDRAKELAEQAPGSTLVLTDEQTAGRGRDRNRWWSSTGALTFSLLVPRAEIPLAADQLGLLSLATGVAVCEALATLCPAPSDRVGIGLKWPNDIFLAGMKVCGILTEVTSGKDASFVVGVGLNVNNRLADAPVDVQSVATSLVDSWQRESPLTVVLEALIRQFQLQWEELRLQPATLVSRWQEWCILRDKYIEVVAGSQKTCGTCRGIASDGALVVHNDVGEQVSLYHGTVEKIST